MALSPKRSLVELSKVMVELMKSVEAILVLLNLDLLRRLSCSGSNPFDGLGDPRQLGFELREDLPCDLLGVKSMSFREVVERRKRRTRRRLVRGRERRR